jgi:murein DD-endopeptidase MepM/ murein hydrolase activator NlpD
MLKKIFEITTKYQKEIIVGIALTILLVLILRRQRKPNWLAPSYPVTSPFMAPNRPDHNGTDFGGATGSPILAIENGIVEKAQGGCTEGNASCNGQRGNFVLIDHQNGYKSIYLHLSEILVQPGQKVKRGKMIGKMGNTGLSTGTHLHLSVTKNGKYINPELLFKGLA